MEKWIELNTGELVNLDITCNIMKYDILLDIQGRRCMYEIEYEYNSDRSIEYFHDKIERDKRFEEIKAMLIGDDGK